MAVTLVCKEKRSKTPPKHSLDGAPFRIGIDAGVANRALFALFQRERSNSLLASARRTQHIVKSFIFAKFCEQRIRQQIFVGAIILLDRSLEQMKSRLLLTTEREERALVIPRLRIGIARQAGFRFVR